LVEVLHIGREIARGLAAAHARGLVHRDIKPANIWLERKDEGGRMKDETEMEPSGSSFILHPSSYLRVKIVDFGLAREARPDAQLTQEGVIVGTPAYMAPEQARNGPVDARCDLFSLGCVLYRMSTGEVPFHGSDLLATLVALATEVPQPPRQRNPELPEGFSVLVLRLLAKRAADRPASALEVVRALTELERAQGEQTARVPKRLRSWRLWTAAGLVLVLGALAGAWYVKFWLPMPRDERPAPNQEQSAQLAEVHLLEGHTAEVECVAFLPGGQRALSGGRDRIVRLWDLKTGKQLRSFPEESGWIHALAVSPDGRQALAAGGSNKDRSPTRADCVVHLLDVESGKDLKQLQGHTDAVNALAFVPGNGRFLSVGWDSSIRLWDTAAAKEVMPFAKPPAFLLGVAVSFDGKNAVTGGTDGVVRVWDLATGKVTQTCKANAEAVYCVAYTAEGLQVFAAGADNTVRLWNLQTSKVVQDFTGHTERIWTVAVSPDGKRLLSGSMDRTMRLWDVESGKQVQSFTGHTKGAQCVTFSPDGRRALSCSGDKTIRLWQLP
jgi:WD40 repeat protein